MNSKKVSKKKNKTTAKNYHLSVEEKLKVLEVRKESLRKNPEVEEYAHHIATVLNLQSLHDIDMMTDANLGPVLLEINPRPSGSLAGLSAAGFALLDYALAGVAGIQLDIKSVEENVEILTYTESLALS